MTTGTFTTRMVGAAALVALFVGSASAQTTRPETEGSGKSTVVATFEREFGAFALEYWTGRLNEYKTTIDRTLSSSDLQELNRQRVRWGILLSDAIDDRLDETAEESKAFAKSDADGGEDEEMELEIDEMGMGTAGEALEIFGNAQIVAGRYRPDFATLQDRVLNDLGTFVGELQTRLDRFTAQHRRELEADPETAKALKDRGKIDSMLEGLKTEKGRRDLSLIYGFAVEPIIMLYNGTDLRDIFNQTLPTAGAIAGMEIPASSVLKQNFPNPASDKTTIAYTLPETSSATLLRIFDATGNIVRTIDEGSRSAGEHTITVDVADLASGAYLYHLTVTTSKGEQVFSKGMRVVR